MPYILQSVFILLGPAFYAASIYMALGRLICFLEGQHHSPIRVKLLTKIFLMGDIFSFFGQGGGAIAF
jgi:surface polysaccharide O-acyltransferase-like enzyme